MGERGAGLRTFSASCMYDECNWHDRLRFSDDIAKRVAANHHDGTGHPTTVSDVFGGDILQRFESNVGKLNATAATNDGYRSW